MDTGSFPGVKCGRGVLLTTHPLLVAQSWKSRAIPLRRKPGQLHSLKQIPTQHDMLPQQLIYKNEPNREYVITLARKDEAP